MEVEKKRSKGGFFQLFDWNGKSRKKLFTSTADSSGESKHGKQVDNLTRHRPRVIDLDGNKTRSSHKGSGDFSSASSVTSDEGYGAKAPGVVARLMGLDSLPTSNVPEPIATPYLGSRSIRVPQYDISSELWNGYNPMDHSSMPYKLDAFSSSSFESRFQKVQSRPIERFQSEHLPPKSAKSIPITHHKLLSPIKSPGFILRNADYIMEAAAKIIEASPQAATKIRVPSVRPSSVPLKIRDLKERMEAADKTTRFQQPAEPNSSKSTKGHPSDRFQGRSDFTPSYRTSKDSEKGVSTSLGRERKSNSLGAQAKVNVQKRDASTSSSFKSSLNTKEKNEVKARQLSKSQTNMQRTVEKGASSNRPNNVLRQNNQKQNTAASKTSSASKAAVSNQQGRKVKSVDGSATIGLRTGNKAPLNAETRKTVIVANDTKKELALSRRKSLPGKKQPVNGDVHSEGTVSGNSSISQEKRSIRLNFASEGHAKWAAEKMKTGMDVISFTFSSPIKGTMPTRHSGEDTGKSNGFVAESSGDNGQTGSSSLAFDSPGFNIIDSDLSVLLEEKLRELACRIESSNHNVIMEKPSVGSASSFQDSTTTPSVEIYKRLHLISDKDMSSTDNSGVDGKKKWQFGAVECGSSSSYSETITEVDQLNSSPISFVESSSAATKSCSDRRNGMKKSLFALDEATSSWISSIESQVGVATELSDTASSISVGYIDANNMVQAFHSMDSTDWELDYIKLMLRHADLMFIEFASGHTNEVIVPDFFNQLEDANAKERNEDDYSKNCRKLLFDCVSECLGLKCQQLFLGTCKGWGRCENMCRKRTLLAEEVYKEVSSWKSMEDMMVDELVERDMNTKQGRWLDFDAEAFEEGVEIEEGIFSCLVDELISDFLVF